MDADRWQQISRLYLEALERPVDQRDAFLAAHCQGDEALRWEVASLLAHHVDADGFLATPADAPDSFRGNRSQPSPGEPRAGAQLGAYRIERPLGRGGMGAVFKAYDTTLHRIVALKLMDGDRERSHSQLLREARNAAALNHPNICTIYEVGQADGATFIAMEYIDGRPLSDRLAESALSVDEAVRYGIAAADALTYAHEHGVIHRDLKAANAMVSVAGRLKLVDFGLARREDPLLTDATTIASLAPAGVAVGTPYSMAPEQVRGGVTTARTDIWALGVLLYEMVTGAKPFRGSTVPELFSSILRDAPAPLPAHLPEGFRQVIARCLAKNPDDRCASAGEVRSLLEAIQAAPPPRPMAPAVPSSPETAAPVVRVTLTRRHVIGLTALIMAATAGVTLPRVWPTGGDVRALAVLPFENLAADEDLEYLCDGIAESLIRQVSRLPSIRAINIASVLNMKGQSIDPQAAGRQLGVETILVGALRRDGARLIISARLVDVATGRRLWGSDYDRDAAELLDVQDDIAAAIMDDGLRVRLNTGERQRLVRHPTRDGDAYDLYLQARFIQRRATEEDYLYARELLQRAVVRDPAFALAYAALSGTYAMMVTDGLERPTDAWPQVNRYMRQALEIDPDLPEALAFAHALAFLFDWDWAGAERARERLLQFPVGDFDPQVLRAMAMEHWALGRPAEALQLARRTRELDPRSPFLAILEADYLLHSGQLDAAAGLYEYAIGVEPDSPNAYFGLAEARSRQGRFDDALAVRRKAHAVAGDERLEALFATARGEAGYRQIDQAWVRIQLDALRERERASYVSPLDFARAYAQLGQKEQAFKYLDAAFVDRSPGLVFLKVDPAWTGVRDDPRFSEAIRRVGLP
jgi:serine/threonine-protein kinase